MSGKFARISAVALLIIILTAFLIPGTAYAVSLRIDGVSPHLIANNIKNTITITGAGFTTNTIVRLRNYDQLGNIIFISNYALTADIPAGIPAGVYDVVVDNNIDEPVTCGGCLEVKDTTESGRPQIVVTSTRTNVSQVQYGQEFRLFVNFKNAGSANSYDVKVTFTSEDMTPTKNGGLEAIGTLPIDGEITIDGTFIPTASLYGRDYIMVTATVSYYDGKGGTFTDSIVLPVKAMAWSDVTPTATGVKASQLVITSYGITLDELQPGKQFTLTLTAQNMGNIPAQRVTMIVGGGSSGGSAGGTPSPGGVSGGGGEFANFAPVGASNIQSLGDIGPGGMKQVSQDLIVNVSTAPGAYPIKITFSYVNDLGEVINDDQVITLLVYDLPKVDISFYREPGQIFVGQPNVLPIQVTNLGKHSAVLGNMKIETSNGTLEPASTLVGPLDTYFTFDSNLTPDVSGPLHLTVTIDYVDDFNQPRTITRTLDLVVDEAFIEPTPDPAMGGGGGEISNESFLQKVWRFLRGLFGLDSTPPDNGGNPTAEPVPNNGPIQIPPGGGKGG